MQRRQRSEYHRLYGATRQERAQRMVDNKAPENELAPRATTYVVAQPHARFTDGRYVETIDQRCIRTYVIVRSQKFHLRRKYYQVQLGRLASTLTAHSDSQQWRCNCRDTVNRCKHVIAVELTCARIHAQRLRI